ncbi:hypothetical protein BDP27DRAFT_1369599 [Rhodocollybia butyracea]|uniref:Uncharacterized protein n=1 Tax=Rhodocollybia butyracea TaxID=206335 RepID=A0A9P5PF08_9AGAR|nr:hypothetical protein BDP27DRAFT_1369599 [Rhodocollybia butyracea]
MSDTDNTQNPPATRAGLTIPPADGTTQLAAADTRKKARTRVNTMAHEPVPDGSGPITPLIDSDEEGPVESLEGLNIDDPMNGLNARGSKDSTPKGDEQHNSLDNPLSFQARLSQAAHDQGAPPSPPPSTGGRGDAIAAAKALMPPRTTTTRKTLYPPCQTTQWPPPACPLSNRRKEMMKIANVAVNSGHFPKHIRDPVFDSAGFTEKNLETVKENPSDWYKICFFNERQPKVFDTGAEPKGRKPKASGSKGAGKAARPTTNLYDGPLTALYEIKKRNDQTFVEAQQTFGFNSGVGIHVTKWLSTERSYSVAELRCNQDENSPAICKALKETLQDHFLGLDKFHDVVAENVNGTEPTSTKVSRIVHSFTIVTQPYMPYLRKIEYHAWALFMLPTANDEDLVIRAQKENQIRAFIRTNTLVSGPWMTVYIDHMECTLCKSDSHSTHGCPYSGMDTWRGPQKQVRDAVKEYAGKTRETAT